MRPPDDVVQLESLLESLPISLIATDLAGIVTSWNEHATRLFGVSRAQALGRPIGEVLAPLDTPGERAAILAALRDGGTWEGEYQLRLGAGEEISLHVIDSPLRDADGELVGILGLAVDVTEERREARAILEAVVAASSTSITVVGTDNCITLTVGGDRTPRGETSEYLGRNVAELSPGRATAEMIDTARKGGTGRSLTEFGGRFFDSAAVRLPDTVVRPGAVAVIATDITERLTEAARFGALVENLDDVLSIINADGTLQYLSPSVEKLTGYSPEELIGRSGFDFLFAEEARATRVAFARALAQPDTPVAHNFSIRHRDGRPREVEQVWVNRLHHPRIRGIASVASDVTEQRAEERRRAALNRLNASIGEIGAVVISATDRAALLQEICRILVDTGGFDAAAFSSADGPDNAVLAVEAVAGQTETRLEVAEAAATLGPALQSQSTFTVMHRVPVDAARPEAGTCEASISVLPLRDRRGVLTLSRATGSGGILDGDAEHLLLALARHVASGLDAVALEQQRAAVAQSSARREQQQSTLATIGLMALGMADTDEIDAAIVAGAALLGLRHVAMYDVLPDGDAVLVRAVAGSAPTVRVGQTVSNAEAPLVDEVLRSGEPVVVSAIADYPGRHRLMQARGDDSGSALAVPVSVAGAVEAVLAVRSAERGQINSNDLAFFESLAHISSGMRERARFERSILHNATHDTTTDLPNLVLVHDRLGSALQRRAAGGSGPLALMVVDIDHFKLVNDVHGRAVADEVLLAAGTRLRSAIRPGDTVGRLGADEFVILCEDLPDASDAAAIAGRIVNAAKRPLRVSVGEVNVTMSVGVVLDSPGVTPQALLRDAGLARDRAHETGRARYEFVDETLRERLLHRVQMEYDLRVALEREQFVVAYQPIIDIASGAVREAEALLRWTRADGTSVSPVEFIPVAEQTGLIVPIGAWVLQRACEDAVRWNATLAPGEAVGVGVNLSVRQLTDPEIVPTIAQALESTGLDPALVRLEITETALMDEAPAAAIALQAIDALGIRLSVDDFGTGYSSLLYLRRFPVRVLKVDRYFVAGLGKNPEDEAIVRAVISLAHSLGLTATAEGIETEDQLERVRALHCDAAQGWLWSKAVPYDEFVPLVQSMRGDDFQHAPQVPEVPTPSLDAAAEAGSSVVLVDDSPSDRGLLRFALHESGQFTVVGEGESGEDAITLAAEHAPELLILDMSLAGMSGLEALEPIHAASPATTVVILSGFLSPAIAEATARAGAFAHFDKGTPFPQLVDELLAMRDDYRMDAAARSDGKGAPDRRAHRRDGSR